MTRAKEELYLCHARMREFRGSAMYAVPSMFLDELPADVKHIDQSAGVAGTQQTMDAWRSGGPAAASGWEDAGVRRPALDALRAPRTDDCRFAEGMVVRHEEYGEGQVTRIEGYGALRKVKVRFRTAGERTFIVDKARLTIVRGG
jgi:DNA helicase-2/ATP-dependent DNA helicase PcrA